MSDLINRQQAIDVLEEQLDYLFMLNKKDNPTAESKWDGINWAKNTIAELPTAEPKEYAKDGTLTVQMPTIKEAKAVDKIVVYADTYKQEYHKPREREWCHTCKEYDQERHCCLRFICVIGRTVMELEEEYKPKVGKWVKNEHGLKCCSVCGERPLEICYFDIDCGYTGKEILSNYCPHCGAKMERSE